MPLTTNPIKPTTLENNKGACVLSISNLLKQGVEFIRRKDPFHDGSHHHGQWASLNKVLK